MSVVMLISQLETLVENCTNSNDLHGLDGECQALAYEAGEAIDRIEMKEEGQKTCEEDFDTLTRNIRRTIEESEDMEECEIAANLLDKLAERVLRKMTELGPPK